MKNFWKIALLVALLIGCREELPISNSLIECPNQSDMSIDRVVEFPLSSFDTFGSLANHWEYKSNSLIYLQQSPNCETGVGIVFLTTPVDLEDLGWKRARININHRFGFFTELELFAAYENYGTVSVAGENVISIRGVYDNQILSVQVNNLSKGSKISLQVLTRCVGVQMPISGPYWKIYRVWAERVE